jgi:phosphopantothenoylcysteine decarboxylase/phosphopantothenate--cysteine ligase
MDLDMWAHPATRGNLERLAAHGVRQLPVGEGELASGLHGPGRMAEPEEILAYLDAFLSEKKILRGKKVLVTAGPTHEAIDPVRFIGNHSTGKMGIALADALCAAGAEVTLVLGPTALRPASTGVSVIPVRSAREMFEACADRFSECDIAVFSAAVADYAPREAASEKIKKQEGSVVLELVRTPDIAGTLSPQKKPGQLVVGFALETENERANALDKLQRKKFDLLVLNSLRDEGAGFGHDTNRVTIFDARGGEQALPLMDKRAVAEAIVRAVAAI